MEARHTPIIINGASKRRISKEVLMGIGIGTTIFQGGGLIFGFTPFADQLVQLPNSPFTYANVGDVFAIGHNLTAWGCILSGFLLDHLGPRACAVSGLMLEGIGHFLLAGAADLNESITMIAYGAIGLGGTQVLLAALSFTDAFRSAGLLTSTLTAAYQAGAFIFIVLHYVPWKSFFFFYSGGCFLSALVTALLYPDEPLPADAPEVALGSGKEDTRESDDQTMSFMQLLLLPGTRWFLLTFMIAGTALIYGSGEFFAAMQAKDNCSWNDKDQEFTSCLNQQEQDILNDIAMPLVGNFIAPVALSLGALVDRTGFALPAFINIFSVQCFIASLWLLDLGSQYLTLIVYNIANAAVFTVQNAYICANGASHIGSLFAASNFVLGCGNVVSDWLNMNPFSEGQDAVKTSLTISCAGFLVATCPLYMWVYVEAKKRGMPRTWQQLNDMGEEPMVVLK